MMVHGKMFRKVNDASCYANPQESIRFCSGAALGIALDQTNTPEIS